MRISEKPEDKGKTTSWGLRIYRSGVLEGISFRRHADAGLNPIKAFIQSPFSRGEVPIAEAVKGSDRMDIDLGLVAF